MNKPLQELYNEYYNYEFELAKIANNNNKTTIDFLVDNIDKFDLQIVENVAEILRKKLLIMKEIYKQTSKQHLRLVK